MDIGAIVRDYSPAITTTLAFVSGFIALVFKDRSRILFLTYIVLGIIGVAVGWYSIYENGVAAQAESNKRIAMKGLLGDAIKEGDAINMRPRDNTQDDANDYMSAFNVWCNKTSDLIEHAYGKGEADDFKSLGGGKITTGGTIHPNVLPNSLMNMRLTSLHNLVLRVESISMVSGFDPSKYIPSAFNGSQCII